MPPLLHDILNPLLPCHPSIRTSPRPSLCLVGRMNCYVWSTRAAEEAPAASPNTGGTQGCALLKVTVSSRHRTAFGQDPHWVEGAA